MPITNFPFGVSSFGTPVIGGNFQLPLMGGSGKVYFVDPANGSDSNDGLSPTSALDTVSAAYAKTTDKAGDVVYLLNDGNTSGTARESATITWAKDNTHLVGLCAPALISQRARISPPTSQTTIVTPQLTVSGDGCVFANLSFFEGTSEDSVASECIRVTGSRNVFSNVAMMNMGDATNGHSGDEAASCNLKISGGGENLFVNCYIGLDTAARSTTNANVELLSGTTRNIFRDCIFPAYADAATPLFVKADGSGDLDRFVLFERCIFINADNSAATAMTAAANVHASAGGHVIFKDCMLVGATDWTATDSTVVRLMCHQWDTTNDVNIGIAASVDVT
jgi:hypothetical protein